MERDLQPANHTLAKRRTQFGLKELASGINPYVDIVAIHGIDGDREDSWTADNGVLWLRDLLPVEIPNARILTYGYDANTHGQEQLATEFMHEHAMTFISKLALLRNKTETMERPIIFVAHSSGGLLLKSALIHSHLCHDNHLKNHRAIYQSTHAVAFFGTPHLGSATAKLARSILSTRSLFTPISNALLQHLERDSEALQLQLVQYSAISGQFETKFFYETYDTHLAELSTRVVPRISAVVPGAVNAEAIGIHKDHVHMIKFPSVDDEDFMTVSAALSLVSKAAYQKMMEKGDRHKCTTKEIVLTTSQKSALSNLMRVNAARFDADNRPRCLEGTRVDLLEKISEWIGQGISTQHRRIFWLCGQAGTGKTTISLTVASTCKARGQLGASFFFSRDHAERSDLRLVFPTIAQQLGIFHRPFQKSLAEALELDPDLVHMDPMHQFEQLIVEPLKSCNSFPESTIVVIDALDECKDENPISRILSILSSHIHELPCLKFFITSRPEDHIRGGFSPLFSITQTLILHDIEASVVDGDIEQYLRNGFSTTTLLYPDLAKPDWPSDDSLKSLVLKSGRLFIFAATAMNFILDRNYSNPRSQLSILLGQSSTVGTSSSPIAFLDQLYLQVLRQAFLSGTSLHRLKLLKIILGAIVFLHDPLSPGALESLLGLEVGMVRTTLRHLHSVIVVPATDEHPIRLIHPSFFDFVTSSCSDANFRIDSLSACHEQLAIACFNQMKGLKRNICSIQGASKLKGEIEDLAEHIEQYIPPAMQYACRHWSFHLCIAGGNILQSMLGEFCCGKILYWIEALSLLGYLREGIRHLQDVSKFSNAFSVPSKDLFKALRDSSRFMADHFELMTCASLQLYRSALPLSAPSSFLRKTFPHELDGGMRVLIGEWGQESSTVTTLRSSKGWITSVNVSPDGSLIVSASHDDEVRLWDRHTGTLLHKLNAEPYSEVTWARFFPDGTRVIAGTSCYTISIWDVTTGAQLQTVRLSSVDSKKRPCYTISPDFARIAASAGSHIYMWLTSNGGFLKTLSGHSDEIESVAFSPNHMLITSASRDHTIRIWNAIDGTGLRTLRGHSDRVWVIAFSPDSKYIVSGSWDKDIRLWDTGSGIPLKILKGHTRPIISVAFSQDGTRVISGSWDDTIRVWDAVGGQLLQALKTIRGSTGVRNVGFSPDGKQYISSTDETIYLWDADRPSNLREFEEWDFTCVRFSPDGTYITGKTGSQEPHNVWDGLIGTYSFSFDSKIPVTHSPDHKYLAFSSNGRDLSLWDSASRTIFWTIQSRMVWRSIAFSSDSARIISTSISSNILRILDVASGNVIKCKFGDALENKLEAKLENTLKAKLDAEVPEILPLQLQIELMKLKAPRYPDLERQQEAILAILAVLETKLGPKFEEAILEKLKVKLESHLQPKLEVELEAELEAELGAELQTHLQTHLKAKIKAKVQERLQAQCQETIQVKIQARIQAKLNSILRVIKRESNLEHLRLRVEEAEIRHREEEIRLRVRKAKAAKLPAATQAMLEANLPLVKVDPKGSLEVRRKARPEAIVALKAKSPPLELQTDHQSSNSATFSGAESHIIVRDRRSEILPHVWPESQPAPSTDEPSEQLEYLIEGEWIFVSKGTKKERCVWIPQDWRVKEYSSRHGRVAIGTRRGLVLLDLSGINSSI